MASSRPTSRVTIIIDSEDGSQRVYSGLQGFVSISTDPGQTLNFPINHVLNYLTDPVYNFVLAIEHLEPSFKDRKYTIVENNPIKKPVSDSEVRRLVKKAMDDIKKGL